MVLTAPSLTGAARIRILTPTRIYCRHKSIHASILRGAQNDNPFERGGRGGRSHVPNDQRLARDQTGTRRRDERRGSRVGAGRESREGGDRQQFRYDTRAEPRQEFRREYNNRGPTSGQYGAWKNQSSKSEKESDESQPFQGYVPESLPFTTAASQFLYGFSSVDAAIRARRRKLYALYVDKRGQAHERFTNVVARAKASGLKVHTVDEGYARAFDKASVGRPHNVCNEWHHSILDFALTSARGSF